jgi:hypothetical protein
MAVGLLNGAGGLLAKACAVAGRDRGHPLTGLALLPYPYLLGAFSVLMLGVMQIGLQRSRAATLVPAQVITGNAFVMVAGSVIFHEPLPSDPRRLALRLAALVVSLLVLALRPPAAPRPAPAAVPAPSPLPAPRPVALPAPLTVRASGCEVRTVGAVQGLVDDGGEAVDGGVPLQTERAEAGGRAHGPPAVGVEGEAGPR